MNDPGFWTILGRLALAYVIAVPIGWNRERSDRSAGLRAFPLVAVAACGFVLAPVAVLHAGPSALARVLQGLISGIGFIGGGAILKHHSSVHGTATAASLWATGMIGSAVALGAYEVALLVGVAVFATLRLLKPLKEEEDKERDGRDREPSLR